MTATPKVIILIVTTMVVVRFAQMLSCRFGLGQDNFRRAPARLKSNCRDRYAPYPSVRLRPRARTRDDVSDTGHVILARASRNARRAVPTFRRTPPHFGRGNSVEPGDGFVDRHRRCLRHRRRHESGRYSRHSPSLGTGSSSQRVAFGCTRGFDTCPAVLPSMIAVPP